MFSILSPLLCWFGGLFCCFKICGDQNKYQEIENNDEDLPPRYDDIISPVALYPI